MARRERMDEDALAALVDNQIADARQFATSDLIEGRDRALEYVRGEVRDIPAEQGKSSVTSRDLSDHLNWIMPGLLRVFLASDRVAVFEPNKQEIVNGEDVSAERAAQATDYINYVFMVLCRGYHVLQSAFYDGLLLGNGIIKHWWDDTPEYETKSFTGLTEDQYLYLVSHPDVEKVLEHSERAADVAAIGFVGASAPSGPYGMGPGVGDGAGVAGVLPQPEDAAGMASGTGIPSVVPTLDQSQLDAGPQLQTLHDCKIKRRVSSGRLRVEALPPEEFLIERNAKALDETVRFCAHYYQATRSELIERGYSRSKVDDMAAGTSGSAFDTADLSRDGTYLAPQNTNAPDRATELVDVYECYILCDYDGDGIAERRRVVMAGGVGKLAIVENEEWEDDIPFSDLVPEPVPHRWKGRTLYEELQDVMRVKTVLMRQTLDNLYQTNNPMNEVVENSVSNLDALVNRQLGANIFVKQANSIKPLEVPFVAEKSFSMLEYWDQQAEKRTGVGRSSMGLDPDALQNQTAEAVRDSRAASATKTEAYARNMAEMGLKRLFRCLLKLATAHQDRPRTIRLRGKWVEMNPELWDPQMDVSINTGLGSGSRDRDLAMLTAVTQKQELILTTLGPGNPIVGLKEYRDSLAKMTEAAGMRNPEQFFKEVTDEALQQFAQAQQAQPDPKMAEAQAKMQLEQAKAQHDAQMREVQAAADLQHRQQELEAKAQFDRDKAAAELQTMRDKMAAEIETMREKHVLDMELARDKAHQEMLLKAEELRMEAGLKREEMQIMGRQAASTNIEEARPQ